MGFPVEMFWFCSRSAAPPAGLPKWEESILDREQKITRPQQLYSGAPERHLNVPLHRQPQGESHPIGRIRVTDPDDLAKPIEPVVGDRRQFAVRRVGVGWSWRHRGCAVRAACLLWARGPRRAFGGCAPIDRRLGRVTGLRRWRCRGSGVAGMSAARDRSAVRGWVFEAFVLSDRRAGALSLVVWAWSRSITFVRRTAVWWPSTTCPSTSRRERSSAFSARTARARRRPSSASKVFAARMAERFGCSGSTRQPRLRSCGSASVHSCRTRRCQAG